jgi:hypothetical protein
VEGLKNSYQELESNFDVAHIIRAQVLRFMKATSTEGSSSRCEMVRRTGGTAAFSQTATSRFVLIHS